MKRKILIKVLIIIMTLTLIIGNVSYASDVTLEELKSSMEKIFIKDIVAKDKQDGTETWSAYDDAMITDSKITIDEDIQINYSLERNIAKFNFNLDAEDEVNAVFAVIGVYDIMQRCYLSSADTLDIDKSLAYTHFDQQTSGDLDEEDTDSEELEDLYYTNEIFKLSIEFIENQDIYQLASILEIDLDKLATLDDSKIDKSKDVYTITLQEPSEDDDTEDTIELTNKQLKEELKEVFLKDINAIEQDADGAVTEILLSLSDSEIKIDDSNINIDGKDIIKYESLGQSCVFTMNYDAKNKDEVSLMAFEQFELMMRCYLATAKGIGVDISLAYTDIQYVIDEMLEDLEEFPNGSLVKSNDRFIYILDIVNNGNGTYSINASLTTILNQLSKLTEDKIDASATMYKVTLQNPSKESEKINDNSEDDTTVKGEIPYTGASYTVIIAIITILVIGMIAKAKYNKLKDIK